jgi:hypothetical protein
VALADAVRSLRSELDAAMVAGAGESLRFELGPVEIEFAVTVRRDGGGSAAVNVMVVTAERRQICRARRCTGRR